jgi:hypothetical protein
VKRLYFGHANSSPTSDIDSHPRLEIMEVIIPEGTATEDLLKKTPAASSTHHSWAEDELALMILEANIPAIADETGYWGLNLQEHEIVFIGNIGKSAPPNIQDHPDFAVFMSFADLKRFKNHFIPDKGTCYLLRISPGCGCCPHEAEIQGPWFSRENAEARMAEVKRWNSKSMRIADGTGSRWTTISCAIRSSISSKTLTTSAVTTTSWSSSRRFIQASRCYCVKVMLLPGPRSGEYIFVDRGLEFADLSNLPECTNSFFL